jgi:hypothetical protein
MRCLIDAGPPLAKARRDDSLPPILAVTESIACQITWKLFCSNGMAALPC